MNMLMSIPLPLERSQPVPPGLRRALICCMAAFAGALLLWFLPTAWHAEAEAQLNNVRTGMQEIASLLTRARETEAARTVRAKRFALVKAALDSSPHYKPEWKQLSGQLSTRSHIAEPTPPPRPPPVKTPPKRRFDGVLWRDGRIVALWFDGAPVDPATEPAIRINESVPGAVVSGRRHPLSPGQSWPLQDRKSEP